MSTNNTKRRQTIQKDLILRAVRQSCDHPNADAIYRMVADKYPSVSRSTVYRNLHILVDEGKIRLVRVTDGSEHFDKTLEEHYHIQCEFCHRVDDVVLSGHGQEYDVIDASGYKVNGKDLIFRGVCPECQKIRMKEKE